MGRKKAKRRTVRVPRATANHNPRSSSSSSAEHDPPPKALDDVDSTKENHKPKSLIGQVIKEQYERPKLDRPKGLDNLGNTCYFNSVMQVLSQTPELLEMLEGRLRPDCEWKAMPQLLINDERFLCIDKIPDNRKEVTAKLQHSKSDVTVAFTKLLREMNSPGGATVRPVSLKKQIGSESPQFRGYDQQDSHELLRTLLGLVKDEETNRNKATLLKEFKINPKTIDTETRTMLKSYSDSCNFTVIDSLFGGYLISSVKCGDCEWSSEILEPFFDLSLPISEPKNERGASSSSGAARSAGANQRDGNGSNNKKPLQQKPSKENQEPVPDLTKVSPHELTPSSRKQRRAQKKVTKRQAKIKEEEKTIPEETAELKTDLEKKEPAEPIGDIETKQEQESTAESAPNNVEHQEQAEESNKATESCANPELPDAVRDIDSGSVVADSANGVAETLPKSDTPTSSTTGECSLNGRDSGIAESSSSNGSNELALDLTRVSPSVPDEMSHLDADFEDSNMSDVSKLNHQLSSELDVRLDAKEDQVEQNDRERLRTISEASDRNDHVRALKVRCLAPIAPRPSIAGNTPILESCLSSFFAPDLLIGSNKIICDSCSAREKARTGEPAKVYTNGSRQMIVAYPPPVLTLHLKRFYATGYSQRDLRKISRIIKYPTRLNIAPWVSPIYKALAKQMGIDCDISLNYELYGIVEHHGTLRSGHYTAYVRLPNAKGSSKSHLKKLIRMKPFVGSIDKLFENLEPEELGEPLNVHEELASDTESMNHKASPSKWFYISDSSVRAVAETMALKAEAYLLFYEQSQLVER